MDIRIVYLKDYKQYISTVVSWIGQIQKKFGVNPNLKTIQARVMHSLHDDKLPLTFIALLNDKLIGMCSLYEHAEIKLNVSPWLCKLFVEEEFRKQGIGRRLVEAAQAKVRALGYKHLYLYTTQEKNRIWYEKLGFYLVRTDTIMNRQAFVMRYAL